MKYIKIEDNLEIIYYQPLVVDDRLVFTDDPEILAEHGYYPLHESECPASLIGHRIVRRVEFDTDHYDEIYEYVAIGEDDELTPTEVEIIMGGGTL